MRILVAPLALLISISAYSLEPKKPSDFVTVEVSDLSPQGCGIFRTYNRYDNGSRPYKLPDKKVFVIESISWYVPSYVPSGNTTDYLLTASISVESCANQDSEGTCYFRPIFSSRGNWVFYSSYNNF